MNDAMYCVTIGRVEDDEAIDDWRAQKVMAPDALTAAKKIRLFKKEYVSEIEIISRLT